MDRKRQNQNRNKQLSTVQVMIIGGMSLLLLSVLVILAVSVANLFVNQLAIQPTQISVIQPTQVSIEPTISVPIPTDGNDSVTPAPDSTKIAWQTNQAEFTIRAGTADSVLAEFIPTASMAYLSVQMSAELQGVLQVDVVNIPDLQANQKYALLLTAQSESIAQSGVIQGELYFSSPAAPVDGRLPIRITINGLSSDEIPTTAGAPSDARIVEDVDGQKLVKDELIVGLKPGTANPDERAKEIAKSTGGVFLGSIPGTLTYQVVYAIIDLNHLANLRQIVEAMPDVEFVSRDFIAEVGSTAPNSGIQIVSDKAKNSQDETPTHRLQSPPCYSHDSKYDSWDENNPAGNNWHLEMIKAPSAWCITTGSASVNIALIDVDIDIKHEDLNDNFVFVDGQTRPYVGGTGHGTHVAGLICAEGNNNQGVTGVMWKCTMRGYEAGLNASEYVVRDLMTKAAEEGADIVNISMQWVVKSDCKLSHTDDEIKRLGNKVREINDVLAPAIEEYKDVLWVFAAGNGCIDARYESPASLTEKFPDNTITVASVNQSGYLSEFSNNGEDVTVAAPGGNVNPEQRIFSTLSRNCGFLWLICSGDNYNDFSYDLFLSPIMGTSQAAPQVTGLAGLILSAHPEYSAAKIKQCILDGAKQEVPGQPFGIINAFDSVKCESHHDDPPPEAPREIPESVPPTDSPTFEMPTVKFLKLQNGDNLIADIRCTVEEIPNAVKYQWSFQQNGNLLSDLENTDSDCFVDYAAGMGYFFGDNLVDIKPGDLEVIARAQINVSGELMWTEFSTVTVVIIER